MQAHHQKEDFGSVGQRRSDLRQHAPLLPHLFLLRCFTCVCCVRCLSKLCDLWHLVAHSSACAKKKQTSKKQAQMISHELKMQHSHAGHSQSTVSQACRAIDATHTTSLLPCTHARRRKFLQWHQERNMIACQVTSPSS